MARKRTGQFRIGQVLRGNHVHRTAHRNVLQHETDRAHQILERDPRDVLAPVAEPCRDAHTERACEPRERSPAG